MVRKVYLGKSGVARSMASLLRGRVILQGVKELQVAYHRNNVNQTGTKKFLFENVPQLKYHNPELKVTLTHAKEIETSVRVILEEEGIEDIVIPTKKIKSKEIMDLLISMTNAIDERTPDPNVLDWKKHMVDSNVKAPFYVEPPEREVGPSKLNNPRGQVNSESNETENHPANPPVQR
eukprot:CFRG5403T1